jgi:enterochelin esterase-like enzyme
MRGIGPVYLALALLAFPGQRAHAENAKATATVRAHKDFASKHLENRRDVTVYLPPGYETARDRRYPVFYLQDSQARIKADETAERLMRADKIRPFILVWVANTKDRFDECAFHHWPNLKKGGKGHLYGKFLTEELKPFIDKEYRTLPDRENTVVGGVSLGGLVSLDVCRVHSETFAMCAAMSPSLQWGDPKLDPPGIGGGEDGDFFKDLDKDAAWVKKTRIWLDVGSKEFNLARARRFARFLESQGRKPGSDFQYLEVKDAGHDVKAWAERFDQVLLFLFAK